MQLTNLFRRVGRKGRELLKPQGLATFMGMGLATSFLKGFGRSEDNTLLSANRPQSDQSSDKALTIDVSAVMGVELESASGVFDQSNIEKLMLRLPQDTAPALDALGYQLQFFDSSELFELGLTPFDLADDLDLSAELVMASYIQELDFQVYTLGYVEPSEAIGMCYPDDDPFFWLWDASYAYIGAAALLVGSVVDQLLDEPVYNSPSVIQPVTPGSDQGAVTEDQAVSDADLLTVAGALQVTDPDPDDAAAFDLDAVRLLKSTTERELGELVLQADGTWLFSVENQLVQYLGEGESETLTYQVASTDGTTHVVVITINGVDDLGEILIQEGDSDAGSVQEDVPASQELLSTSGSLTLVDPDASAAFDELLTKRVSGDTNLGDLIIQPDGQWEFQVANSQLQFLAKDQELNQTFEVSTTDGQTHEIRITLKGTNDLPVIDAGSVVTSQVQEVADGAEGENTTRLTTSGSLVFDDVDVNDTHVAVLDGPVQDALGGKLLIPKGQLTLGEVNDGRIDWDFKVDDSALDALAQDETLTQVYSVLINDGQGGRVTQQITITLTGTNDRPVIDASSVVTGQVQEVADSAAGENTTRLTTSGSLVFDDVDVSDTHVAVVDDLVRDALGDELLTPKGELTLGEVNDDGRIDWDFKVDDSALDSLAQGETLTQVYSVVINDGQGGQVTQTVTISLGGSNDAPTIQAKSDVQGRVIELPDGDPEENTAVLSDSGIVYFDDVDLADGPHTIEGLGWLSPEGQPDWSNWGAITFDSSDANSVGWTFKVDDYLLNGLADGETRTQVYQVKVSDQFGGSVVQDISIQLVGRDDASEIIVNTALGDADTGALIEDVDVEQGLLTASGSLSIVDIDSETVATFDPTFSEYVANKSSTTQALGALQINFQGEWSYSVVNSDVQYLAQGQVETQVYRIRSTDGSIKEITLDVTGANDAPIINLTDSDVLGTVTEDQPADQETLVDTGVIKLTDVDLTDVHSASIVGEVLDENDQKIDQPVGELTLLDNTDNNDGSIEWRFEVSNSAVNFLAAGETLEQRYDVAVSDGQGGQVQQTVMVTIIGSDDQSTISVGQADTDQGQVTEDQNVIEGDLLATGSLSITDVDATDTPEFDPQTIRFIAEQSSTDTALGVLGITADGQWNYTVANAEVQYLGSDDYETQVFQVESADGAAHQVTIRINGVNDVSVIDVIGQDSDTGSVIEDSDVSPQGQLITAGTLTVLDPDRSDSATFTEFFKRNGPDLGQFTIGAQGAWEYSVDNALVQYLGVNQSVDLTYTVRTNDGTEHDVDVTIQGVNDLSVITVDSQKGDADEGVLTEDQGVVDGDLVVQGSLSIDDVDQLDFAFFSGSEFVSSTTLGSVGEFSISGDGDWTYRVSNEDVQDLASGESDVRVYQVSSLDGVTHDVTITINGQDESAVVTVNPMAGPFVVDSDLFLDAYAADGQLMFTLTTDSQGQLTIIDNQVKAELVQVSQRDSTLFDGYQLLEDVSVSFAEKFGDVVFRVRAGGNFIDEGTSEMTHLDTDLRAVVNVPANEERELSITAFTEAAVRLIEKAEQADISIEQSESLTMLTENYELAARAIESLVGVDIIGETAVAALDDPRFTSSNDQAPTDAEMDNAQYGVKLAALSKSAETGSVEDSLTGLLDNLDVTYQMEKVIDQETGNQIETDTKVAIDFDSIFEFTRTQVELTDAQMEFVVESAVVNSTLTSHAEQILTRDAIAPNPDTVISLNPVDRNFSLFGEIDLIDNYNLAKVDEFLEFKIIVQETVYIATYDETLGQYTTNDNGLSIIGFDPSTGLANWEFKPGDKFLGTDTLTLMSVVTDSAENAAASIREIPLISSRDAQTLVDDFLHDTAKNDQPNAMVEGTEQDDLIYGFTGDDILYGYQGNDTLLGQAQDDLLIGGQGNDLLMGGLGDDFMLGGVGQDTYRADVDANELIKDEQGQVPETVTDVFVGGDGVDRVVFSHDLASYGFSDLDGLWVDTFNLLWSDGFRQMAQGDTDLMGDGALFIAGPVDAANTNFDVMDNPSAATITDAEVLAFKDVTLHRVGDQDYASGTTAGDIFAISNHDFEEPDTTVTLQEFHLGQDTIALDGIYLELEDLVSGNTSPLDSWESLLSQGAETLEIELSDFVDQNGSQLSGALIVEFVEPVTSGSGLRVDTHADLMQADSDWWDEFASTLNY